MSWLPLLAKIPFERILFRPRDNTKKLDELKQRLETASQSTTRENPAPPSALQKTDSPPISLPTTEQTVQELKRRLGKEIYRMEMDLQAGGRIANRPCDCLSHKHTLGLEATAEELMSYERNPIYGEIVSWLRAHQAEFEPAEIAKHSPSYYQGLAPEVRRFRKQVMGTETISILARPGERLTLDEAKRLAAEEAAKEVERKWH